MVTVTLYFSEFVKKYGNSGLPLKIFFKFAPSILQEYHKMISQPNYEQIYVNLRKKNHSYIHPSNFQVQIIETVLKENKPPQENQTHPSIAEALSSKNQTNSAVKIKFKLLPVLHLSSPFSRRFSEATAPSQSPDNYDSSSLALSKSVSLPSKPPANFEENEGSKEIFAFGVFCCKMLTNYDPFLFDGSLTADPFYLDETMTKPKPLISFRKDVPQKLSDLVAKCLEKGDLFFPFFFIHFHQHFFLSKNDKITDPENRHKSTMELEEELARIKFEWKEPPISVSEEQAASHDLIQKPKDSERKYSFPSNNKDENIFLEFPSNKKRNSFTKDSRNMKFKELIGRNVEVIQIEDAIASTLHHEFNVVIVEGASGLT